MRRSTIYSTSASGFKMDIKLGLTVQKSIYTRETWDTLHFKGICRRFSLFYYCACAKTPLILHPVSNLTQIWILRIEKHFILGNLALKLF